MKTLAEIRPVKEAQEQQIFERAGVTGVDIGYKMVGGKRTEELAIRIYVDKKQPQDALAKGEMIPKTLRGIKTDVIERRFVLQPSRLRIQDIKIQEDATRYATLHGGIGIGPCRAVHLEPPDVDAPGNYVFVGTLGAVVTDRATGDHMLLSNFHVMCVNDGWQAGDQMCQPSRVDGGACPADVVGALQRAVLQGSTAGDGPGVDCAVASHGARPIECTIEGIGDVTGTAVAIQGMAVRKRGRTTGLTYGTVDSVDLSARLDYGDGLGEVILTHQISILPDVAHNAAFGDHGDSGSVVVDDNGRVIGLHFAGDDADGSGVANPIQAVLDALNVDLCTVKQIEKKVEDKELEKKWESKEIEKKWEQKEFKFEKFELKEYKLEKFERKEIKELEKRLEVPGWPTLPTQPAQPTLPGAPRGLEERIAALETALRLRRIMAGAAPQAKQCIDFSSYPAGVQPNPWAVGGASFLALDYAGNPWGNPGIAAWGPFTGLHCGYRLEITLSSPCTSIEATLVHFAHPAKMEAYNRDGSLAGGAAMSGPQQVAETLAIAGTAIDKVVVYAAADETLLLRFCCEGMPPQKQCIDFRSYLPQVTPNPWAVGGGSFLALDHVGKPWGNPGIKVMGGFRGLDCGYRLEITLSSPWTSVEATLVHFAGRAEMKAINRDGSTAGAATMSVGQNTEETLTIAGAAIDKVVITSPADEVLLLKFCWEGKPEKELKEGKPERKELKDGKLERKELKDRIKEIKEYKEPKEIKDRIKDFKEPKEIYEGSPKEIYEGNPKEWVEGEPKAFDGGNPPDLNQPVVPGRPGSLEERLAQLEAAVAQMAHFVGPELRPDLSMGALKSEPDYSASWKPYGQ
jgi:hypothetical protein